MLVEDELAHCSNHSSFFSGCGDCAVSKLYRMEYGLKLQKALRYGIHHLKIDPSTPSPKLQLIRQQLHSVLKIFFSNAKLAVLKAVSKEMEKVQKASSDEAAVIKAALEALKWDDLVDDAASDLAAAFQLGGLEGLAQLEISSPLQYSSVNTSALEYAKKRSAEMIGKRLIDGKLVDNPNARLVIADTTRDDIKDLIQRAFQQQTDFSTFKDQLQRIGTFSDNRANLIARAEIATAQIRGNLGVWKKSGIVKTVDIILSANHAVVDICDTLAEKGPYPISSVPNIPAHPLCFCGLVAAELSEQ